MFASHVTLSGMACFITGVLSHKQRIWLMGGAEGLNARSKNSKDNTHKQDKTKSDSETDQRDGYQNGGIEDKQKVKGNVISNIVVSLHSDR